VRDTSPAVQSPRSDDRSLWDIFFALRGYPAVVLAHQMKLFELLGRGPQTLSQVCATLGIARRPAETLLSICTSLGFAVLADGRYTLTPLAEDYLLQSSPTYFGWYFEAFLEPHLPESLRNAVKSDRPQGFFGDPAGSFVRWHGEQATNFTRAMHSASMAAALEWPNKLDLSGSGTMLDIGGGSGAHSIGAAMAYPNLNAIVLDVEIVCSLAKGFISHYGLQDRISVYVADFFADPFPRADVHFYGMVFHDWPEQKCRFLVRKSFESLTDGGRIIIHEMFFNENRTGPFAAAAFNVDMLLAMPGEQYSGSQVAEMVADAGFKDVELKSTFGYWSIVTGLKGWRAKED
jgi:hypothetical protein